MSGTKHFDPPLCYIGYDLWMLREWLDYVAEEEGLEDYVDKADVIYTFFLNYVDRPHVPGTVIDRESLHMKDKWDPWLEMVRELSALIAKEQGEAYALAEPIPFYHTENLFKDLMSKFRERKAQKASEVDPAFAEFS